MQSVSFSPSVGAPASIGWTMFAADAIQMDASQFQTNMGLQMMCQMWTIGFEPGGRWWGLGNDPMSGRFQPTLHSGTEDGVPRPMTQAPALLPLSRPPNTLLRM